MAYKRTKVVVKLSFSSLHVSFSATDLLHHLAGNLVENLFIFNCDKSVVQNEFTSSWYVLAPVRFTNSHTKYNLF